MKAPKALIIDDEKDISELIRISLDRMSVQADIAHSYQQALQYLEKGDYQLCFTDMRLPDGDGLDILSYIQQHKPELPVAMITAHGTMETAIAALKRGAFDFVAKPIDLQVLRDLTQSALKLESPSIPLSPSLLGEAPVIETLRKKMQKIARSQAPVYIHGPSGSGKELVARLIHQQSSRSEHPFVPVNCGAIPRELMESEFFGHMKGSFTGANQNKQGLFQAAHHGTLFLDEVADLPFEMQVKLLRAIQERMIRPVGAPHELAVDARIVCATHQNLYKLVLSGSFREDLYYRLNVIEIEVPPLLDRKQDIPMLISHILHKLAPSPNQIPKITESALKSLMEYDFPGNIRELENILERAYALCDEKNITENDLQLPKHTHTQHEGPLENYLDDVQRDAIIKALEETNGNKTKAAIKLGITFRALRYRLKKLNLE